MRNGFQKPSSRQPQQSSPGGVVFLSGIFTGFIFSALMFAIGIGCLLTFGVVSVRGASPICVEDVNESQPKVRSVRDLRLDVKAFVKNSKQDDDLELQVSAVLDLCALHREIVHDPRFETNDRLKSLRAQIASRLKRYNKDLKLTILRRERDNVDLDPDGKSKSSDNKANENLLGSGSDDGRDEGALDASQGETMSMMFATAGGPGTIFGYLQGNFAPPWDYGDDLVRLIETTIAPDSWRSAGGEGVIHYYQPLRIIVVSATSRVHDDMTDMLRQMRRLSR